MKIKQSGYEGLYQMCIGETLSAHRRDAWTGRVTQLMEILPEREAEVLKLRFNIDSNETRVRSQQEVGDRLGLSKERIRQIEDAVMHKLSYRSYRRFLFLGEIPEHWRTPACEFTRICGQRL